MQDLHFRHLPPDGCHATSVVDKQEQAAEESNQVQGLSTQASLKDQSCHHTIQLLPRADMPRPTKPVKRVCYADDITVWASGVQIPVLEQQINSYLEEMSTFLKVNSLLISAPKSTVTLFTPDPFQARFHPKIAIADAILPLERTPKILGVLLDTSFAFHHHCEYVANRVSKRNNILKALAGTSWGQQKETLLMTYKAVGRSIADYAAPVWSTNASVEKIQVAQNEALRISTGAHKMSSIDHLY